MVDGHWMRVRSDLYKEDAKRFLAFTRKATRPVHFAAANDVAAAGHQLWMKVRACSDGGHGAIANPFIMASSPAVMSVGARCQGFGYHFHWCGTKTACVITPGAGLTILTVAECVPYLDQDFYEQTNNLSRAK